MLIKFPVMFINVGMLYVCFHDNHRVDDHVVKCIYTISIPVHLLVSNLVHQYIVMSRRLLCACGGASRPSPEPESRPSFVNNLSSVPIDPTNINKPLLTKGSDEYFIRHVSPNVHRRSKHRSTRVTPRDRNLRYDAIKNCDEYFMRHANLKIPPVSLRPIDDTKKVASVFDDTILNSNNQRDTSVYPWVISSDNKDTSLFGDLLGTSVNQKDTSVFGDPVNQKDTSVFGDPWVRFSENKDTSFFGDPWVIPGDDDDNSIFGNFLMISGDIKNDLVI
jgi:hypothetical protein